MSHTGLNQVVFLDRDGVINRDAKDYVKSIREMIFIPGSLEAIRRLTRREISVFVVTNQSAVGRGMITERTLLEMNAHLKACVKRSGGEIMDIFYCPHAPEAGCGCRKPRPGMIEDACARYDIDLSTATLIGDSARDIECARNAGCKRAILVRSGLSDPTAELGRKGVVPDHKADDLSAAVRWLISLKAV